MKERFNTNPTTQFLINFDTIIGKIDKPKTDNNKENNLKGLIANFIAQQQFGRAIEAMMELMDYRLGVYWHRHQFAESDRIMIIRDARRAEVKPIDMADPYIIMAVNYLRAVRALLPEATYKTVQSYLYMLIRNFIVRTWSGKNKDDVFNDFETYNIVLINNLADKLNITFDEARSRLNLAKDFVNLEEVSKDLMTVTHLLNHHSDAVLHFQADFGIRDLTPDIKEEYVQKHTKKWYQNLEPWQQALVDKYTPIILQEQTVLPTQLRSVAIPGIRNGYETLCGLAIQFPDEDAYKCNLTCHLFHAGTLATFGKSLDDKEDKENKRITMLNADQLKKIMGKNSAMVLTLNSDINKTGEDPTIVSHTALACTAKGIHHSNLPMNKLRQLNPPKYTGIEILLSKVADEIIPKIALLNPIDKQLLQDFLRTGNSSRQIGELQRRLKNHIWEDDYLVYYEAIKIAIEIRHLILSNDVVRLVSDPDNQNLKIATYKNLLVSALEAHLDMMICFCCASGKDRAMVVMHRTAIVAANKQLLDRYSQESDNEHLQQIIHHNMIALAKARHPQTLASWSGGTIGAHGIKKDTKGAIPEIEFPQDARDLLIEETASYNKEIPIGKDKSIIFFPIGNADPSLQVGTIIHVLKLQQKQEASSILAAVIETLLNNIDKTTGKSNVSIEALLAYLTSQSNNFRGSTLKVFTQITDQLTIIDQEIKKTASNKDLSQEASHGINGDRPSLLN